MKYLVAKEEPESLEHSNELITSLFGDLNWLTSLYSCSFVLIKLPGLSWQTTKKDVDFTFLFEQRFTSIYNLVQVRYCIFNTHWVLAMYKLLFF